MTSFQTISRKQIPRSTSTSWSSWSSWSSGQPMKMQPVQAKPQRITTKFTNSRQVRISLKIQEIWFAWPIVKMSTFRKCPHSDHVRILTMSVFCMSAFAILSAFIKTLQFPEYNFCLAWSIGQSRRELSTRQWMYNLGWTSITISWTTTHRADGLMLWIFVDDRWKMRQTSFNGIGDNGAMLFNGSSLKIICFKN